MEKDFTKRDFFEGLLWFVLVAQVLILAWWGAECFDRTNPDQWIIAIIWFVVSFILLTIGTIGGKDYIDRVLTDCYEEDDEEE